MSYRYAAHRIAEILRLQKVLPPGDELELEKTNSSANGREFETRPELLDGPFVDMRYLGKAPLLDEPTSYDASFLIANRRVRGVGYADVERQNFRFKKRIPKGWHLNVCDPNLPTHNPEHNVHHPLSDFAATDFHDFIRQTAKMWQVDLGWDAELFS
jgi:hypothetical protein